MGVLDSFMGSGSKSFPFDTPGDHVTGIILDVQERQQTDMKTGELKSWDNGQPKMMFTIKLQTELRVDEDDDGIRHVNVKWKSLKAVQEAVRKAGAKSIALGGQLTLQYTHDGPKERGMQAPKEWGAAYTPPDPGASFMGTPATEPAQRAVQARNVRVVNHQGDPQSAEPPAWAVPQAQASTLDRLKAQQAAGVERLAGATEREKFGF